MLLEQCRWPGQKPGPLLARVRFKRAWSSIVRRGPEDALTIKALPGFSIRVSDLIGEFKAPSYGRQDGASFCE
jgi:hypothetical protein